MTELLLAAICALAAGAIVGWLIGRNEAQGYRAERDQQAEQFRRAITDLAGAEERARAAEGLRDELDRAREERSTARGP